MPQVASTLTSTSTMSADLFFPLAGRSSGNAAPRGVDVIRGARRQSLRALGQWSRAVLRLQAHQQLPLRRHAVQTGGRVRGPFLQPAPGRRQGIDELQRARVQSPAGVHLSPSGVLPRGCLQRAGLPSPPAAFRAVLRDRLPPAVLRRRRPARAAQLHFSTSPYAAGNSVGARARPRPDAATPSSSPRRLILLLLRHLRLRQLLLRSRVKTTGGANQHARRRKSRLKATRAEYLIKSSSSCSLVGALCVTNQR